MPFTLSAENSFRRGTLRYLSVSGITKFWRHGNNSIAARACLEIKIRAQRSIDTRDNKSFGRGKQFTVYNYRNKLWNRIVKSRNEIHTNYSVGARNAKRVRRKKTAVKACHREWHIVTISKSRANTLDILSPHHLLLPWKRTGKKEDIICLTKNVAANYVNWRTKEK